MWNPISRPFPLSFPPHSLPISHTHFHPLNPLGNLGGLEAFPVGVESGREPKPPSILEHSEPGRTHSVATSKMEKPNYLRINLKKCDDFWGLISILYRHRSRMSVIWTCSNTEHGTGNSLKLHSVGRWRFEGLKATFVTSLNLVFNQQQLQCQVMVSYDWNSLVFG